jgi:hypothetical protein
LSSPLLALRGGRFYPASFIIDGLTYDAPESDEDNQNTHTIFESTDLLLRDFDLFHVRKGGGRLDARIKSVPVQA